MQSDSQHVVRFHYRVFEPSSAEPLLSSFEGDPISVLLGRGGLIPGLERALLGRSAGERFEVDLDAADAYGERRPELTQRVPKKHFRAPASLRAGEQTYIATREGRRAVTVKKVGMSVVDVDLNHPLAGKDLHFEIEVVEVREASAEEIAHGHAHGPGGHRH